MSLSASSDEVQTVILSQSAQGAEEQTQIDAQEDRRIMGWQWIPEDLSPGTDFEAKGTAFVGTRPSDAEGSHDIGGKFHTQCQLFNHVDSTNGVGANVARFPGNPLESDASWDWNEDVTLTMVAYEEMGNSPVYLTLIVYYREV